MIREFKFKIFGNYGIKIDQINEKVKSKMIEFSSKLSWRKFL